MVEESVFVTMNKSMVKLFIQPLKSVLKLIDATGMYRAVTYALGFITIVSLLFGLFGLIPYTALELLSSLVVVLVVGLVTNYASAFVWQVHANHESAVITALITFFLTVPASINNLQLSFIIALAIFLGILSKYVLAWKKQHVINPAAAGVLGVTILYAFFPLPPGYFEAGWWIGQPVLFIPLLIAGLVVVTKVRKWLVVSSFIVVAFLVYVFEEWQFTGELFGNWERFFLSGPSLFLAFFMLTEPFTMPPRKQLQGAYGILVGFLSQTTLFLPLVKMTPSLALVIGNILFYPFTLKKKLFLKLKGKQQIAKDTYEFVFEKPKNLAFTAGQYLEWMLPHQAADERGERRYFTIASSPTESVMRIALRFVKQGSSYKNKLQTLDIGEEIIASQLAGDFVLPKNREIKLGFIAGGIGVTPFRSHIQYMIDSDQAHDTVLWYACNTEAELAYKEYFEAAKNKFTFDTVYVLAHEEKGAPFEHGFITTEMLKRRTPDYLERYWYLSGPPPMVNAYIKLLKDAGVPSSHIKTDFFPGLA